MATLFLSIKRDLMCLSSVLLYTHKYIVKSGYLAQLYKLSSMEFPFSRRLIYVFKEDIFSVTAL